MRVLFVTPPFYGLLYPVISLAHGLRAAGHEVLVATCGKATANAAAAGLPTVDCAPEVDVEGFYTRIGKAAADRPTGAGAGAGVSPPRFGGFTFFGAEMADRVIAVAERWRPDLVVHPPHGAAGPLVAAKLGVPSVLHGLGFVHSHESLEIFHSGMAAAYERHGLAGPPRPAAWLDVAPPSMRIVDSSGRVDLRCVPYNGGGVLPDWLFEPIDRPRVAVTLGTVNPKVGGLGKLAPVVEAAKEVDAEFVIALGDVDAGDLGELPHNVRPAGWIPLGALLATSSAVVHHGGAGTVLTALDAGLPQIVIPGGADQPANAEAVAKRGCGLAIEDADLGPDLIHRLLTDADLARAAAEVRGELRAMPSPANLVPYLVELAGAR
jgi:UDP:flavonoid glycosyltransferase YjiC (YdhE family)